MPHQHMPSRDSVIAEAQKTVVICRNPKFGSNVANSDAFKKLDLLPFAQMPKEPGIGLCVSMSRNCTQKECGP